MITRPEKNMNRCIAFFVLIARLCNAAANPPYYTYGSVHMMAGYPMVGIGIRTQKGVNGFDFSASALPYFVRFSNFAFHCKGLYLFHPKSKGVYMGAGLGLLQEPVNLGGISGSGEGSFGLEWQTRKGNMFFFEADVIAPFPNWKLWPGLSFGYGF
jgi:hypothetical protein